MSVTWFYPNKSFPIITVASYGITFNQSAMEYLKNGKSVILGCDLDKKQVFIKIEKVNEKSGFIIPEIDENKKTVRINCKDFIQFLGTKAKLDVSETSKFYLEYVEKDNMLTFNINEQIKNKKTVKKTGGGINNERNRL